MLPNTLDFTLPPGLEAGEPPEMRGLERDQVRLMVSRGLLGDTLTHHRFRELPSVLRAGDVLVINTSGTLKAAVAATDRHGTALELHFSTQLPAGLWIVEVRRPEGHTSQPYLQACAGDDLDLPAEGRMRLLAPYDRPGRTADGPICGSRLWIAAPSLPTPWLEYLDAHGFPIRYAYARDAWPASAYQTVYATEPGSAELPSAGRAFTPALITHLVASGVQIAPLVLHTGVSSPEDHEPPYEEQYRVPLETARVVNSARREGRRVIAVGTTAVRALETVVDVDGVVHPGEGWTRLIITPQRGVRAIDELLTGLHEPRASHLAMLEALAGREHLAATYAAALAEGYLWHEFGDLHLILPKG